MSMKKKPRLQKNVVGRLCTHAFLDEKETVIVIYHLETGAVDIGWACILSATLNIRRFSLALSLFRPRPLLCHIFLLFLSHTPFFRHSPFPSPNFHIFQETGRRNVSQFVKDWYVLFYDDHFYA